MWDRARDRARPRKCWDGPKNWACVRSNGTLEQERTEKEFRGQCRLVLLVLEVLRTLVMVLDGLEPAFLGLLLRALGFIGLLHLLRK